MIEVATFIRFKFAFAAHAVKTNQTTEPFKSPHSPPHLWWRCVKNHSRRREGRKRKLAYLVVNAAQFAARVLVVVFSHTGLRCGSPLVSASPVVG